MVSIGKISPIKCIIILVVLINESVSIPLSLASGPYLQASNGEQNAHFNITMPDSKTVVNVFLKMKMMYPSETRVKRQTEDRFSSTSVFPPRYTTANMYAIEDVIKAFRRNLRTSERNIGGILESPTPFYRHFMLQYKNNKIPIRCTYTPVYAQRCLTIDCLEYRETKTEYTERVYSNGEVGAFSDGKHEETDNLIIEAESIDSFTQTYHMTIADSGESSD